MINNNELSETFEKVTGQKFEFFYHKYRPKLVWYLTRYTKDQEIAADFADDAFTQALIKIGNYNADKSQIHTWVYKIGENLVKKDYKDKKRLSVFSLDKENSDNLNLVNILPQNEQDGVDKEDENILDKKADIVRESIFNLPDKYKKVMIMRELENKPYLEIAELCTKDYPISITKNKVKMPEPNDFLDLTIENKGKDYCYINFEYDENKKLQMKILPGQLFTFNKHDINDINQIKELDTEIKSEGGKKINCQDVYYIICLLNKVGISFNDITKILSNNNLNEYIIKYFANIRRSSLPECNSSPSKIKKFYYNEKTMVLTPIDKYIENNKDYFIDIITELLSSDLSNELRISLTKLLNKLKGNNVEICNITYDEDVVETKKKLFDSIEIDANGRVEGVYRTTTNLSTIKSQISKGRQLIQSMVKKRFQYLDDNGIDE
jgi:RNA polymerase sigma-70 factor (ECF subfamily)